MSTLPIWTRRSTRKEYDRLLELGVLHAGVLEVYRRPVGSASAASARIAVDDLLP